MRDFWDSLPTLAQDIAIFAALLAPFVVIGISLLRGFAPWRLLRALIWRYRGVNMLFLALIALSVGIGCALIAQERGFRSGTARAADGFDLIVAAPGSEITALLGAVYLRPSVVPLLDGETFAELEAHPRVRLAAPLAFGDSLRGHPVVGTLAEFIPHLSGDLAEGQLFDTIGQAVIGSGVDLAIGEIFTPSHGIGDAVEDDAHEGTEIVVTGRMRPTGTPWDRAILVAVEEVWLAHGLPNGHAPEQPIDKIGPPFDAAHFPGTPAALVVPHELYHAYSLQSAFTSERSMAFLPGAVLTQLHSLMGNVRAAMSAMALVTQALVAAGVLAGLLLLARLFARQLALLRALGAPARFVLAVIWSFAALLIVIGSALGLGLAWLGTGAISAWLTERTGILIETALGWPELHLVAGFTSLACLIALAPGLGVLARNTIHDLSS